MSFKNKIGVKIKKRRSELGLTQKEICGEYMTRNMLSLIESGSALPSIESAEFLAEKLNLPLPYLFSEDDNLFAFERNQNIEHIKMLFSKKKYSACIDAIDTLSATDDELNYIYAISAYNFGKSLLMNGSLLSAEKYLNLALNKASESIYDTLEIETTAELYLSIARNIQSPLLELDTERYLANHIKAFDYEFYKYVTQDYDFEFDNIIFRKHLEAKSLLKKYKYNEAIALLQEIEESKNTEYNAYVLFSVYTDLENAYKQIGDFENAYRYSSKRLVLINAFNS